MSLPKKLHGLIAFSAFVAFSASVLEDAANDPKMLLLEEHGGNTFRSHPLCKSHPQQVLLPAIEKILNYPF